MSTGRKKTIAALGAVALMTTAGAAIAFAQGDETPPGDVPECIEVAGQARYRGLGYDHVILRSSCEDPARCEVWTDVNPEHYSVTVDAGATEEVVTFRGSPSREFTPQARCALRD